MTPSEFTTPSGTPVLELPEPSAPVAPPAAAFTFKGPWFSSKEARAYCCLKTMKSWYTWRHKHGIVPRRNGSVLKADLDRALKFRPTRKQMAAASLNNLRRSPTGRVGVAQTPALPHHATR